MLAWHTVDGKASLAGTAYRAAAVRELIADEGRRVAMWRKHFVSADANCDGVLDPAEAKEATRRIVAEIFRAGDAWRPADAALDAAFKRCDRNSDGVLTQEEFGGFVLELLRAVDAHAAQAAPAAQGAAVPVGLPC